MLTLLCLVMQDESGEVLFARNTCLLTPHIVCSTNNTRKRVAGAADDVPAVGRVLHERPRTLDVLEHVRLEGRASTSLRRRRGGLT